MSRALQLGLRAARIPTARGLGLGAVALAVSLLLAVPGAGLAAERTVRIADGTLTPKALEVTPGTTVTWVNEEGNRHRVRSTAGPAEFDSGNLDPGASFSVTFTAEGTYAYVDDRDREDVAYHGTIVVSASSPPAPTNPPASTPRPGSTPAPGVTPPPAAAPAVRMAGRLFRPATVTIDAGQSVVFVNDDDRDHTATARDGSFDTGTLRPGGRATRTFATPGTFPYFCVLHPDMVGTIAVRGPGGAPPPPPPPATPTPKPTPAPPPPAGGVAVVDFAYRPATLTVTAGASITWVNQGVAPHTVTARDGSFDSGLFGSGRQYTRTFPTPGTFPYFCTLHPEMTGTVRVAPPGGGPIPTPRPSPPPTPRPSAPPPTATTVDAADNVFRPGSITVAAGTTVTWRNVGTAPHTVTAADRSFDSGIFGAGATWSRSFAAAGTFPYFCAVHPGMTGAVVVTAAAAGASGAGNPDDPVPSSASPAPPAASRANPEVGVAGDGAPATGSGTGPGANGAPEAAPSDPAPASAPASAPVDPLRLVLVGLLVLGAVASFGGVVRGLAPRG